MAPTSSEWLVFSQWLRLLQRSFGVDQHVGDVLDVAHLPFAATHLQQRIVGGRCGDWSDRTAARGRAARGSRRSAVQFSPLMS